MCKTVQKKEWIMDTEYRVQQDKWATIYRLSIASYMNLSTSFIIKHNRYKQIEKYKL